MVKKDPTLVDIKIDEATTIGLDGKKYSGTVQVDPITAEKLIATERASIVVQDEEVVDGSTGIE